MNKQGSTNDPRPTHALHISAHLPHVVGRADRLDAKEALLMEKKYPNLNGHKRTADLHKEAQMARNEALAKSKQPAKKTLGTKIKEAIGL